MTVLLAYHADAELHRTATALTVVALVLLGLGTVLLVSLARRRTGRRGAAVLALVLASIGIAAHVALQFMQDWDEGTRLQIAWATFLVRVGSFLLATPIALGAYVRVGGRVAAVAVGLSLVLPFVFVAWALACAVTDACFH